MTICFKGVVVIGPSQSKIICPYLSYPTFCDNINSLQ